MQIADNAVVSMHYTLTDDEGTVIDSSAGSEPLTFMQGHQNIIPGLEKALVGKAAGDKLTVRVEPEEGYGEYDVEMLQQVPREMFQGIDNIEPGMTFQAQDPSGYVQTVEVKLVEGDVVTVDANHPLAGVTLNFDVEIVEVRAATAQELDHGHVHAHGHDH